MSSSSDDNLIVPNKAPMVKSPSLKGAEAASDTKKEKKKEKKEKKKEKKDKKDKRDKSAEKDVASPAAAAASPKVAPKSPKSPAVKPADDVASPDTKKSKAEKKAEKAKAKEHGDATPSKPSKPDKKPTPEGDAPYGYTASGKEKKKPGRKPKSETAEGGSSAFKVAEKKAAKPASPAAALKEANANDAKKKEESTKEKASKEKGEKPADADAPYGYTASGVPKKKPGRPKRLSDEGRKVSEGDLPLATLAAKATEEAQPKKKRGRPRKEDAAAKAKDGGAGPSPSQKRPAEEKPAEEKQNKKGKTAGRKSSDGETLADLVKNATVEVNKKSKAEAANKEKAAKSPVAASPSPAKTPKSPKSSPAAPAGAKRKLSAPEAENNVAVNQSSKRTRVAQSRMSDMVCIVTGGVSGIGRACVDAFVAEKARMVLIVDTSGRDDVAETKSALRKAGMTELDSIQGTTMAKDGRRYFHIATVDVCNDEKVGFLFRCLRTRFGRIDVAVNNAGIEGDRAPTGECTKENFERVMSVNCTGTFICLKNEIRIMKEQSRDNNNVTGSIVNISSTAGTTSMPDFPAYCASKHAIVGLSRTAAKEYAGRGVRVNCLCPGTTQTPMVDRFTANWAEWQEHINQGYPIGRIANADEVAEAVVWLASGSCPFMTGSSIIVDGALNA